MDPKSSKTESCIRAKEEFSIPTGSIYLNGHSLGLLSKNSEQALARVVEEWKAMAIGGWMHGQVPWFTYAEHISELLAPLIGAESEEVIVHGSTTINLHTLLATFYDKNSDRKSILMEESAFPSDRYAIVSFLENIGLDPKKHIKYVSLNSHKLLEEDAVMEAMTGEVQMLILPSVLYQTAQLLDMERLSTEAHKRGILVGFDLCHSIGIVPHQLSRIGVDFAYFCTYKYLNAGPGSVGGLYVNKRHAGKKIALSGWWGSNKERQFTMAESFEPAYLAGGYQIGTPHILSMAPLEGSLRMYQENDIEAVRAASTEVTEYLIDLCDEKLETYGFIVRTPRNALQRGGSVTLEHPYAASINKVLKEKGVVCDYREPNLLRITPNPFYVSKEDIEKAVSAIDLILSSKEYEKYVNERDIVA